MASPLKLPVSVGLRFWSMILCISFCQAEGERGILGCTLHTLIARQSLSKQWQQTGTSDTDIVLLPSSIHDNVSHRPWVPEGKNAVSLRFQEKGGPWMIQHALSTSKNPHLLGRKAASKGGNSPLAANSWRMAKLWTENATEPSRIDHAMGRLMEICGSFATAGG